MSKQRKSIYEYFSDYSDEEIDKALESLSDKNREKLIAVYGEDLHNPVSSGILSNADKSSINYLKKKIKKGLEANRNVEKVEIEEDVVAKVEEPKEVKVEPVEEEVIDTVEDEVSEESDFSDDYEEEVLEELEVPSKSVLLIDDLDDVNSKLLKLIAENKNNREICEALNIGSKSLNQLLLDLKNGGRFFKRDYYSDGSITYDPIIGFRYMNDLKITNQHRDLITEPGEDYMKFLVISDLHFGAEDERIDLVERAFNYCTKNGIHVILCGGDLIDGKFKSNEQKISNPIKQAEYFLEKYPSDKSILTFTVLGDHDYSALTDYGLNLIELLNNYRHDVIAGGYNNAYLHIKDDELVLFHSIPGGMLKNNDAAIVLHGHPHKFRVDDDGYILDVLIPTLSDIGEEAPTALELGLQFNKGCITHAVIKQLYFGERDFILNENVYDVKSRGGSFMKRNNVFDYKTKENKGHAKTLKPMSQIDKFNNKWGMK